jgi:prepilin-type N-terminal cleavage/methylation domain-containing protein
VALQQLKNLKLSKLLKTEKAFSLVEIMVAVAILLVIVITFSTLFTFAFGGIFTQGHKSGALYEDVQKELEENYEQGHTGGTDTLSIDFDDENISNPSVIGSFVSEQFTYESRTSTIYTFIPNGH